MHNEKQNKNKSSDKKKNNSFLKKLYMYVVIPCDVYSFMIMYPVKNKPICSMVEKSSHKHPMLFFIYVQITITTQYYNSVWRKTYNRVYLNIFKF